MEPKIKLELESETSYQLSKEELKNMYITLALSMYPHLRCPDYDELRLLKVLRADLKRLLTDTELLLEEMPNNPRLREILMFFDNQNKGSRQVLRELEELSE